MSATALFYESAWVQLLFAEAGGKLWEQSSVAGPANGSNARPRRKPGGAKTGATRRRVLVCSRSQGVTVPPELWICLQPATAPMGGLCDESL